MSTQTTLKRLRESPTSIETPTKSVKMSEKGDNIEKELDFNEPSAKLVAAFKNFVREELDDGIEKAVRKSFAEELDVRLKNFATKEDFGTLQGTIENQKKDNTDLKEKLEVFEARLERIDKNERSNKLIFSNVVCTDGAVRAAYYVCNQLMKIDQQLVTVKNAFILKKFENDRATILVEFMERNMITTVFQHVKNLSGSKIGVERDLTEEQQKVRKTLVELKRRMLDNNKQLKIHVSDVTMKIGSNKFTFRKGKLESGIAGQDVNKFFIDNYKLNIDEYFNKKN